MMTSSKEKNAEDAVAEAKADLLNAQCLAVRVQKMISHSASAAGEDLQQLLNKMSPVDKYDASTPFETLDKLRADATGNLA